MRIDPLFLSGLLPWSRALDQLLVRRSNNGCIESTYLLARFCHAGLGRPVATDEAIRRYALAHERGHAYAGYFLHELLSQSHTASPTLFQSAVHHLRRAVRNGDIEAATFLGNLFARSGLAENQKLAVRYWRKAINHGSVTAMLELSDYYSLSAEDAKPDEALKWLRRAALAGHPGARRRMGIAYAHGTIVPEDFRSAAKWYWLAFEVRVDYSPRNSEPLEKGRSPRDSCVAVEIGEALVDFGSTTQSMVLTNRRPLFDVHAGELCIEIGTLVKQQAQRKSKGPATN